MQRRIGFRGGALPTYQYACTECGHAFEQVQSFTDDALTVCPQCQGRLRKVFNAVGVVFKGSGFYRTDSRAGADGGGGKAAKSPDGSNGSGDSGGSSEKKSETTASGSSSSSTTSSTSSTSSTSKDSSSAA
jgi:putative FmdB family regulatory protein